MKRALVLISAVVLSLCLSSAVPSEYFSDASEQGSVETLTYDTKNYACIINVSDMDYAFFGGASMFSLQLQIMQGPVM